MRKILIFLSLTFFLCTLSLQGCKSKTPEGRYLELIQRAEKYRENNKIADARKAYRTKQAKGYKMKKPMQSYTNKKGVMVTYQDIAMYQLRGPFDSGWRKANNPGADFFGFSEADTKKLEHEFVRLSKKEIEENIIREIKNGLKK